MLDLFLFFECKNIIGINTCKKSWKENKAQRTAENYKAQVFKF